jgi:dTDP-4-amino-4,6-dideoxygalactose transaminase
LRFFNRLRLSTANVFRIPFISLKCEDRLLTQKIEDNILQTLSEYNFIKGRQVRDFETSFSNYLSHKPNVISTANGTDALFIALKTLGISSGDEVLTPAMSWISSAETITLCGATPVFVDVDILTFTMDYSKIEEKITPRTRGIVIVHLYGQAAALSEIDELCKKYNLLLIEDCAQAHLTTYNAQTVGTFGDAGAFSFYPTKNLGAYGDAGCISTTNLELAEKIRRFANHGSLIKEDHLFEGMNSRMDSIQASVLLSKLPYLNNWNKKRNRNAAFYSDLLKNEELVKVPYIRPGTFHSFHIFAIRAKKRNELQQYLAENGIQTLIHYPQALPNLIAYRHLNNDKDDFPVATALQSEVLSLPIYPGVTEDDIEYICEKINKFYSLITD